MVSILNFPSACIYKPMQYTDQASFFGKDGLIMLKSPISGILFIQIVKDYDSEQGRCSYEFRPVKTI